MDRNAAERRRELYSLLGDLPPRDKPIRVESVAVEEREEYVLERLVLDLNGLEPVPAYLVSPRERRGSSPVVVYNHAHGGDYTLGKEELLAGREILQTPPYAVELTRRGYAALCVDMWGFGGRGGRSESAIFKEMLWRGRVMWGMMVYDTLRAIDYVVSREDVDAMRIATMGMSMGSTMAWWVAALDERVKVCVDLCCLTDYEALIEAGNLDGHGVYYYVPGLLKHFAAGQINALIAPRAHLGIAGERDALTPVAGLDRIDREVRETYEAAGAPGKWKLSRHDVGHVETAEMRGEVMDFLDRWL